MRLHHSRSRERLPDIDLRVGPMTLTLGFPPCWLEARPLTRADLEEEAKQLAEVGFRLRIPAAARTAAPVRKLRAKTGERGMRARTPGPRAQGRRRA